MSNNESSNLPKEFNMVRLSVSYDKSLHSDFVVDSLERAIYLINDYLSDYPNEVMIGIALDPDKKPMSCSILGMGNEHNVGEIKSNIFRFALLSNADSIVLAHNHPRASRLELSMADMQEISNIQQVAGMIGIKFRDFIVVGNQKQNRAYYSWWEKRLITQKDFVNSFSDLNVGNTPTVHDLSNADSKLHVSSKYNNPSSVSEEISSKANEGRGIFNLFK